MSTHGQGLVSVTNLGCRVNRVELDVIADELERAGCAIVSEADAEVCVLNTCAVTAEAEAKTRKAVRHAARLPQAPWVVATGCVASLFRDELTSCSERVVVEPAKERVAGRVLSLLGECEGPGASCGTGVQTSVTPTGRTRPGIKVQDGCDLRCSYCIVWKARGPSRSVAPDSIVEEVRRLCARGAREVVLTGINLGCYRAQGLDLSGLLGRILSETEVCRVRLSSIEPQDVDDALLETMAGSQGRVAPFLHVCLQSGSDAVLRRMGRAYTTERFADVCACARSYVADIALSTDLICGFPQESEQEFAESLAFCERMHFQTMHVFRYSRRPGTPAAAMEGQVAPHLAAERARRARALSQRMCLEEMAAHDGSRELVLVEQAGHGTCPHLLDVEVDPALAAGELFRLRLSFEGGRLRGRDA